MIANSEQAGERGLGGIRLGRTSATGYWPLAIGLHPLSPARPAHPFELARRTQPTLTARLPASEHLRRRLGAGPDVHFLVDVPDVRTDGVQRDKQLFADFPVPKALH